MKETNKLHERFNITLTSAYSENCGISHNNNCQYLLRGFQSGNCISIILSPTETIFICRHCYRYLIQKTICKKHAV